MGPNSSGTLATWAACGTAAVRKTKMPSLDPSQLLVVLIGPAIGSFLAVLADRLPRGEDILSRPSACRSCARRLRPVELIPILSFLLLRGRCRGCGAAIPAWSLYCELAAGGLGVLAVLAGGPAIWVWTTAVALWLLLGLTLTDLLWFRLPNPLTAALLAVALVRGAQMPGPGLWPALSGAVLGSGAFWGLRLAYLRLRGREGLGLGDVKLMAGLGALAGPFLLPHLVLFAALGTLALAWLGRNGAALHAQTRLPFGAGLAISGAFVILLTSPVF